MPLDGFIPDTPAKAHLVFEVRDGDPEAGARGLAAAQAVFARNKLAPHLAYMAMQEFTALAIDKYEADSLEFLQTGQHSPEDVAWNRLCDEADIWKESLEAALHAACIYAPDQKIRYRYYMDWDGNKLEVADKAWWPHCPFAEAGFTDETLH